MCPRDRVLYSVSERALRYGDVRYLTVKRILRNGLDLEEDGPTGPSSPARVVFQFARRTSEYAAVLLGGAS